MQQRRNIRFGAGILCGYVKDVRTLIEQGDTETACVIENIKLLEERFNNKGKIKRAA